MVITTDRAKMKVIIEIKFVDCRRFNFILNLKASIGFSNNPVVDKIATTIILKKNRILRILP